VGVDGGGRHGWSGIMQRSHPERNRSTRCASRRHKLPIPLKLRLLAVATLAIAATCDDPASPSATVLRTDLSSYTATATGFGQVEVRLILTFGNLADTAVSLDRCVPEESYPIYLVDLVLPDNAEGAGYNPSWACVGGVKPIVIGPRATRIDTITLHGPTVYDNQAHRYLGVLAGLFRISYGGQSSNEFTIKLPPGSVQ
jgi:hypothetical protein